MFDLEKNQNMVNKQHALTGRSEKMLVPKKHFVNQQLILTSNGELHVPQGFEQALFGMGCFWGVERLFWQVNGVYLTAVGYAAGYAANPSYEEVCSGKTGHNEVVALVFDPKTVGYQHLLEIFWQGHNPTQGMQQGNDKGTQYRSGIYVYTPEQKQLANASKEHYQKVLSTAGYGQISTEIIEASEFYFAEEYHQQYLAKNPAGYCGLGGVGINY